MKREELLSAIGEVKDEWIEDAHAAPTHKRRLPLLAAVLVLGLLVSAGAFAVADTDEFYHLLYGFSPKLAQSLKPVQISCVDNGIEMKVISADVDWDTARVWIGLRDLEGNRIDETCDLYDSYSIDLPSKSIIGHCEFSSFDEATQTALFLVEVRRGDGWKISGSKLTFSLRQFLSGKREFLGQLPLEQSLIRMEPETTKDFVVRGFGGRDDDYVVEKVMVPGEVICTPTEGVSVTGMGYVDGMLRIQAHYDRIQETDNHGWVYLVDAEGKEHWPQYEISFWDEEYTGSYGEYLYPITPEELGQYQFWGSFSAGDQLHKGEWEITFPLE